MAATAVATGVVYNPPDVNFGTTTSWMPLTTPWPSSSGCASSFFLYPGQPAPVAWDPGYGYFAGGKAVCLPPAETTWWEQTHQNPNGFTSLSIRPIVCPSAFTTAVTSLLSVSSTLVMCCPSGYDLQNGQPGEIIGNCMSSLTSGQILTYLASFSGDWAETTLSVTTSSQITAISLVGWNVATPTSAVPSQSTSINSPTNTSHNSSGLSSGAKAGIGVSAAIGGIGIIALICAIVLLRRRPKVPQYSAALLVEAEWRPVHEMGVNQKTAELPSTR
ncbi:hypothetical protein N431DRAFT_490153 [Stipitochalara longipes BDJ]|nr:hypothetical protein N431DRAFT_490153 [Stipitochalara longipes BDJ]